MVFLDSFGAAALSQLGFAGDFPGEQRFACVMALADLHRALSPNGELGGFGLAVGTVPNACGSALLKWVDADRGSAAGWPQRMFMTMCPIPRNQSLVMYNLGMGDLNSWSEMWLSNSLGGKPAAGLRQAEENGRLKVVEKRAQRGGSRDLWLAARLPPTGPGTGFFFWNSKELSEAFDLMVNRGLVPEDAREREAAFRVAEELAVSGGVEEPGNGSGVSRVATV